MSHLDSYLYMEYGSVILVAIQINKYVTAQSRIMEHADTIYRLLVTLRRNSNGGVKKSYK